MVAAAQSIAEINSVVVTFQRVGVVVSAKNRFGAVLRLHRGKNVGMSRGCGVFALVENAHVVACVHKFRVRLVRFAHGTLHLTCHAQGGNVNLRGNSIALLQLVGVVHVGKLPDGNVKEHRRLNVGIDCLQTVNRPVVPVYLVLMNPIVNPIRQSDAFRFGIHSAVQHHEAVSKIFGGFGPFVDIYKIVAFAVHIGRPPCKQTVGILFEQIVNCVFTAVELRIVIAVHERPRRVHVFHEFSKVLECVISEQRQRKVARYHAQMRFLACNCPFQQVKGFSVPGRKCAELQLWVGNLHDFQLRCILFYYQIGKQIQVKLRFAAVEKVFAVAFGRGFGMNSPPYAKNGGQQKQHAQNRRQNNQRYLLTFFQCLFHCLLPIAILHAIC